jgi:hypothetical protein
MATIPGDEKGTLLQRLEKVDRRVIFMIMALAITLPIFTNWKLVSSSTPPVTSFYDTIQALPEGSTVAVADDWDPGSKAELETASVAVLRHLFSRNMKVIDLCNWGTGAIIVNDTIEKVAREFNKTYGVDYCYLGFKEGREIVMQGAAQNIRSVYTRDYHNTPVDQLPVMNGVESLRDLPLLVSVSAGYPGTKEWVQQVQKRFGIPMVAICNGVSEPEYQPYYASGQLSGLVGGLSNIAAYEAISGHLGFATTSMVAQSSGHYMLAALILIGNWLYAASRGKTRLAWGIAIVGLVFYGWMFWSILG